jgi:hypothetical protein
MIIYNYRLSPLTLSENTISDSGKAMMKQYSLPPSPSLTDYDFGSWQEVKNESSLHSPHGLGFWRLEDLLLIFFLILCFLDNAMKRRFFFGIKPLPP